MPQSGHEQRPEHLVVTLIRGRALAGVKTKSFEVAYPHPQNWLRARNAECARKMCEVLKGGPNKNFCVQISEALPRQRPSICRSDARASPMVSSPAIM